eukprot:11127607-Lingulodinium_polyedra.AAC.1
MGRGTASSPPTTSCKMQQLGRDTNTSPRSASGTENGKLNECDKEMEKEKETGEKTLHLLAMESLS